VRRGTGGGKIRWTPEPPVFPIGHRGERKERFEPPCNSPVGEGKEKKKTHDGDLPLFLQYFVAREKRKGEEEIFHRNRKERRKGREQIPQKFPRPLPGFKKKKKKKEKSEKIGNVFTRNVPVRWEKREGKRWMKKLNMSRE